MDLLICPFGHTYVKTYGVGVTYELVRTNASLSDFPQNRRIAPGADTPRRVVRLVTMSVFATRDEKSIAATYCTDRPTYIGTDETGAVHYWSTYDRMVIVVEFTDVSTCRLADCDRPLKHWREHTADERGWTECRITADPLLGGAV